MELLELPKDIPMAYCSMASVDFSPFSSSFILWMAKKVESLPQRLTALLANDRVLKPKIGIQWRSKNISAAVLLWEGEPAQLGASTTYDLSVSYCVRAS